MRSLWTTDMPTYTVSGAGVLFQNKTWTNDSCSDKLEKRRMWKTESMRMKRTGHG